MYSKLKDWRNLGVVRHRSCLFEIAGRDVAWWSLSRGDGRGRPTRRSLNIQHQQHLPMDCGDDKQGGGQNTTGLDRCGDGAPSYLSSLSHSAVYWRVPSQNHCEYFHSRSYCSSRALADDAKKCAYFQIVDASSGHIGWPQYWNCLFTPALTGPKPGIDLRLCSEWATAGMSSIV